LDFFGHAFAVNKRQLGAIKQQNRTILSQQSSLAAAQKKLLEKAKNAELNQQEAIRVANIAMQEVGTLRSLMEQEAENNAERYASLGNKLDELTHMVQSGLSARRLPSITTSSQYVPFNTKKASGTSESTPVIQKIAASDYVVEDVS